MSWCPKVHRAAPRSVPMIRPLRTRIIRSMASIDRMGTQDKVAANHWPPPWISAPVLPSPWPPVIYSHTPTSESTPFKGLGPPSPVRRASRGAMRCWDSSAIVPLCLDEPRSARLLKRPAEEDRALGYDARAFSRKPRKTAIARRSAARRMDGDRTEQQGPSFRTWPDHR